MLTFGLEKQTKNTVLKKSPKRTQHGFLKNRQVGWPEQAFTWRLDTPRLALKQALCQPVNKLLGTGLDSGAVRLGGQSTSEQSSGSGTEVSCAPALGVTEKQTLSFDLPKSLIPGLSCEKGKTNITS